MKKIMTWIYQTGGEHLSGHGLHRYRIVRGIANYLKSNLKSSFVEVDGHKMFLDPEDSLRLSINKVYEPFEIESAKKYIKSGSTVLELGAFIGYHTLNFARMIGKEGKVFAFEPAPNNFELLKKNVELNGYQNVTLIQKAVSDKTGKIRMYLSEENKGDHRIFDSHDNRKFIEIEAIRLDDYFEKYDGSVDFLWMSIQGVEMAAIESMPNLLNKMKEIKIITEFSPFLLKRLGKDPRDFIKLLEKYNFKIYHLDRKTKNAEPLDIDKLLKTYTIEKENTTHLLCVRQN